MKKIFLFAIMAIALASCVNDDTTYGEDSLNITIDNLDESYTAMSLKDLVITPTIESSMDESNLEYEWSYYNNNTASYSSAKESSPIVISNERNLNYNVTLADGSYILVYKVTDKTTGYSKIQTAKLQVTSALSQGFYILKETADGNTDLDLYNTADQSFYSNVISGMQGQSLQGKPRSLDVVFNKGYIDPESQDQGYGTVLSVAAEKDGIKWIRPSDFVTVSDGTSCHYEEVENEIPYRTVHGYFTEYYVTSNGTYSTYDGAFGYRGIYGMSYGNGGSMHVACSPNGYYSMFVWDEQQRSIEYFDYSGYLGDISDDAEGNSCYNTNYDCLFAGTSMASDELIVFLLQDKDDASKKVLYNLSVDAFSMAPSLTSVTAIDADSYLAKGTIHAISAYDATVIYSVYNNKVYTTDISNMSNPENELSFSGLPSGETITYLANRYFNGQSDTFSYLIVGTQSGNTYKLYFYETVGGEPVGDPKLTISGEGKLCKLDYANPSGSASYIPVLDDYQPE